MLIRGLSVDTGGGSMRLEGVGREVLEQVREVLEQIPGRVQISVRVGDQEYTPSSFEELKQILEQHADEQVIVDIVKKPEAGQ